jgi:phage I-like protein
MRKQAHVLLNTSGASGFSPPVEFRLFRAGVNETSKGAFIFDDQAAQLVLSQYQKEGVRVMLDLEHLSLTGQDLDSRAWFDLEVRNGELWAVNVNWTPDGARRLSEKTQVYISPAFEVDDDNRVTKIINVALCAMPATYNATQLVAASRRIKLSGDAKRMDPELVKKAMGVLESADGEAALAMLKDIVAAAASGEAPEAEEPPPVDPALEEMQAVTESETPAQALSVVKAWKKVADETKAASEAALLSERKSLAGKLVTLGAETPATAYVGEGDAKRLADRLVNEPIESLRARVTALSAAKKPAAVPPAAAKKVEAAPSGVTLSAAELADCKRLGRDPEKVLERKLALLEKIK